MLLLVLVISGAVWSNCQIIEPPPGYVWTAGVLIKPSKGEIWPRPQHEEKSEEFFLVNPGAFRFETVGSTCSLLTKALTRYKLMIIESAYVNEDYLDVNKKDDFSTNSNYLGYLTTLLVDLTSPCNDSEFPSIEMEEEYVLNITSTGGRLTSETIWGILRGLESFSQLIYLSDDLRNLLIGVTNIHDFPRFPHRGLLMDTSRHYIPKNYLLRLLDAMSYNKLNVFHWHLTDDYSFPYESTTFPELSNKGRFIKGMTYDQNFVKYIQIYAQERGIRVVPEFDTPGHTLSWGLSHPELLTPCYAGDTPTGGMGPIDPTKPESYEFLYNFFDEIRTVFVDSYLHLGGDEVDFSCWESNPQISDYMLKSPDVTSSRMLQTLFTQQLVDYASSKELRSIVWEEVYTNGGHLPATTAVHVWKAENYSALMNDVTRDGHPAILSGCWYLNLLEDGADWIKFYECDAHDFPGDEEQKARVLGGEACMWAEIVDEHNLEPRMWPRGSAAAEKFWSPYVDTSNPLNILMAGRRLEEHTCRMNNRGIRAQPPTGPSICPSSTTARVSLVSPPPDSSSLVVSCLTTLTLTVLLVAQMYI